MKNRIIALVMGMVLLLFSSLFAVITFERWYGGDKSDLSRSVIQTNSGGYLITASTTSFGAGFWDVYLINVDSIGDTLWSKTYGGIYADGGRSAATTFDAGYIVAGSTNPSSPLTQYVWCVSLLTSISNQPCWRDLQRNKKYPYSG